MRPFSAAVDPAVLERHPDYVAVILVADGIVNGPSDAATDVLLARAEDALRARGLARAADHEHLAAWRAAFSAFGAKPKRYPSSAEALAARVVKGGDLPRVSALVDLYNAISVEHLIPVGGEDADRLQGTLRLTFAAGDEPFDGADGEPAPGEVVWRDDVGVTCRRWNWRQGRRTRLTEDTRRAFFVFDRLDPLPRETLLAAADELRARIEERCPGCEIERMVLDAQRPAAP